VEFLFGTALGKPMWMWVLFMSIVAALLIFDLIILQKKEHEVSVKESLYLSAFYIALALVFGGWVWYALGPSRGEEYFTGFLVEKTLAIDNLFILSLIFTYFSIPRLYQHRVLFWGILGIIILRALMIGLGTALIHHFTWILHIFAFALIITGIRMLWLGERMPNIKNNPVLKFLRKNFHIANELHGHNFLVKMPDSKTSQSITCGTPLIVALVLIECADLIFAMESIPAIFMITLDPYIVYTSNIFAILGLHALYFALAAIVYRFKYLKQALACVLIFIGSKTFIAHMLLGKDRFPASVSLGIIASFILMGIGVSLYKTRHIKEKVGEE